MAARHEAVGPKAWGISNTLSSKAGGGFQRSERMNPDNRRDSRMTAGFKTDQVDTKTVRITHFLGNKHGINNAAERGRLIEEWLDRYQVAIGARFKAIKEGSGEQAHLTVTLHPNPVISETLRKAAALFSLAGDKQAAKLLSGWAQASDEGKDW